jgi:hypothetical protein
LFGAYFLNSTGEKVSQEELKKIYKNRSTLAHGQYAEIDNNEMTRLIKLCQISPYHEIMTDTSQTIEDDVFDALGLS